MVKSSIARPPVIREQYNKESPLSVKYSKHVNGRAVTKVLDEIMQRAGIRTRMKQDEEHPKANSIYYKKEHIVGLPQKDGKEYRLFDYEKTLFIALVYKDDTCPYFQHKHLWVKKATGLGVTEFMLRFMAWLCTSWDNNSVGTKRGSQMCIITGPNIDIAIKLIKRMKQIFERKLGLFFQKKETVIELNGCVIEAFPSNHLDSFRAVDNPKFILLDEADMFRKSEVDEVRHISERYIAKSDPYIVMVSTPNTPGGLFERIEKEPEETCLYKRIKLDYTVGLGNIYTKEEIEKAQQSPGFEREYNLKYLGNIGSLFNPLQVDEIIRLGELYKHLPINQYAMKGLGSSKTAIVLTEQLKEQDMIRVIYSKEFERPNPEEIASIIFDLHRKYWNTWIFVDGANAGFITQLKIHFGEDLDWQSGDVSLESNKIIPVNFGTEHKKMLSHLYLLVNKGYLAIAEEYDKLIVSLRTAYANEYSLDKERTSYDDSLDGLRLALLAYRMAA